MGLLGTDRQRGWIGDGRVVFTLTFIAFLVPVWGYTATYAVSWMRMLDLESFRSIEDVWTYLLNLRTGIPPVLSALELLWWVKFHDLTLFTSILYPITIALAFTAALELQPIRTLHRIALVVVGVFLANQGAEVHAGNPANYDPLFALLLLSYFLLINTWEHHRHNIWLAAAGLCLSLLELTRPFIIYLLPLFLLIEWHRIHLDAPRRGVALAAFLLPVVVLSGGWHLHLYLAHDHQIAWTNISGYNIQRAWEDFDPEIRAFPHLDQLPSNGELWANLNTREVYIGSEELKRLIISRIRANPAGAVANALNRLAIFVSSPVQIYGHNLKGVGIEIYQKLVSALVLLLPAYVAVTTISLLRRRQWPWLDRRWWLAASTLMIALLIALSERDEEARFLFSILPMLLAVAGFALEDLTRNFRAGERHTPCDKGAPACDWY